MYLNIQSCLCLQDEHYILLVSQENLMWNHWNQSKKSLENPIPVGKLMMFLHKTSTNSADLPSVHLESYLQTSTGKACFVCVLFFVALQAQHNRGRGNSAISPILQGISQCWVKRAARWQMGRRTLSLTSCCCSKKAVPLGRDRKSWWLGLEEPEDTELMWSPMDWVPVVGMPRAGLYSVLCLYMCVCACALRPPQHDQDTHCWGAMSQLEWTSTHAYKNFADV